MARHALRNKTCHWYRQIVTVDNVTVAVYIRPVAENDARYSIDELAELGRVSRRTVRYYVQEGLLPAPLGVGRGRHYDASHLDRLLRVKALQEAGRRLDEIRAALDDGARTAPPMTSASRPAPIATWRRVTLAPGVELHVSGDARAPSQAALDALAAWCRAHLPHGGNKDMP